MQVQSLGGENPLEEEMATHSRLENPVDRGAQRAAVHGGVKSRTRLGTHVWRCHRLVPSRAPAGGAPGPLLASRGGGLPGVPWAPPVSSRLSRHLLWGSSASQRLQPPSFLL